MIRSVILLVALYLAFPTLPAEAQLARERWIPIGNLNEAVSNPHPLEPGRTRLVGTLEAVDGAFEYLDQSRIELSGTGLAAAVDHGLASGVISVGYAHSTLAAEYTTPGFLPLNEDVTLTRLQAQYAVGPAEPVSVAARLALVTLNDRLSAGGNSISASLGYLDLALGARVAFGDALRLAALFSPAVSADDTFDGTTLSLRDGHGMTFGGGIGYRTGNLSFGLDGIRELENADALSPSSLYAAANLGMRVTEEVAISGRLSVTLTELLKRNGQAVQPASRETGFGLGALAQLPGAQPVTLGVKYERFRTTYESYGNALLDSDRADRAEITNLALLLGVHF